MKVTRNGMPGFDPESMVVKVDGKEIEWRKIAYRDEPAPANRKPLTAENIVAFIDEMKAIAKLDGTPLHQHGFDPTHKEIHDRISRQITAKLLEPEFAFSPTDKVWLTSSHKPVHDDGPGIWRPIVLPSPGRVTPGDLALRLAMYLALEWVP